MTARPVDPAGLVLVATAAGRLTERGLGRLLATPGLAGLCRLAEHAPAQALRAASAPLCGALGRWSGRGQTHGATLAAMASAALMTTPVSTRWVSYPRCAISKPTRPWARSVRAPWWSVAPPIC